MQRTTFKKRSVVSQASADRTPVLVLLGRADCTRSTAKSPSASCMCPHHRVSSNASVVRSHIRGSKGTRGHIDACGVVESREGGRNQLEDFFRSVLRPCRRHDHSWLRFPLGTSYRAFPVGAPPSIPLVLAVCSRIFWVHQPRIVRIRRRIRIRARYDAGTFRQGRVFPGHGW